MKIIKILSMVTIIMVSMVASAQTINVDNLTLKTNETGSINIRLNGGSTFIASGFIIELPDGFTFTGDVTNGTSSHVTRTYLLNDHTMKVAIFSNQNMAFGSNSFDLLELKVKVPNRTGTYQGKIVGIEYASASGSLVTKIDVSFSITVESASGDVNHDGCVSISDVILIVESVLGNTPSNFYTEDADLNGDGIININDVINVVNIILGEEEKEDNTAYLTCPDENHPHLIDLGLPSGTKWACCNVGADKPEAYGGYYAWGETEERLDENYYWDNYVHCDGSYYTCHDIGSDIAGTQYDVAHVKWGGSWQMPSHEQIKELIDNCTYKKSNVNGIEGGEFTAKNGNVIFLPATGFHWHSGFAYVGYYGSYWSASLESSFYAYSLNLNDEIHLIDYERYRGFAVRPVSR